MLGIDFKVGLNFNKSLSFKVKNFVWYCAGCRQDRIQHEIMCNCKLLYSFPKHYLAARNLCFDISTR